MSKVKYMLIISMSILFLMIGVSLLIYAAMLQSRGESNTLFNVLGATFFIIIICVLVLFLVHEEQLSAYQMKRKEEKLKKGFLSSYAKDETPQSIKKRLAFHGFNEIKHQFLYLSEINKLFGHSEFYVSITKSSDIELSIKKTQELFKDVRVIGPSYGRLVRNCVLIILIVEQMNPGDTKRFKDQIDYFISLEQFGDVFIPFFYDVSSKKYYFRNVKKKALTDRFYFGTREFKKYVFGTKVKIHSTLKNN